MTRVILLADRLGQELRPLTERLPVGLLPVAAKPLLVHCVEDIKLAGLRDVTLVVSERAELIRAEIGTGARWGLHIDYLLSRGEECPLELMTRMSLSAHEPRVVLRGDVLRAPSLRGFLGQVAPGIAEVLRLCFSDVRADILYLPAGSSCRGVQVLAWDSEATSAASVKLRLIPSEAYTSVIDDTASYHRANLDAACGRVPGLLLPGRQLSPGLIVGRHSRVSPSSLGQGTALIGSETRVDGRAKLHGEVVISDNVLIDRDAELQDSVILPNSYVGELVDIRNAIVFGSDLLRVDTGTLLHINDTFLLADLRQHASFDYLTRRLFRLAGVLLLFVSLPLWPVAAALAFVKDWRHPLIRNRLRGNRIEFNELGIRQRRVFTAFEWHCSQPVLRYLPRLLAVISGDLRLVGVQPVTEERAAERIEPWQREADRAPAGLIGPSQLLLPPGALEEDVILSDAVYAGSRSLRQDLHYLGLAVRMLFSRVAWFG